MPSVRPVSDACWPVIALMSLKIAKFEKLFALMKRTVLLAFILAFTTAAAAVPARKFDVYLLIGQSNMAGRGYLTSDDMNEVMDGVYLLGADDTPVPATHPFNQYSTIRKDISMQQMGPGYGFARVMKRHSRRPMLLVVNARGGTSILKWGKGTEYYNEAVRRTRAAMKYGRLRGILWHQGCSDSATGVDTYMALLKDMVASLRSDLKAEKVPFIAGELPYWRPSSSEFNNMLHTITDNIPHSGYVSAEGCTMRADRHDPHFSREAQITLGERYAVKYIELRH